jgi:hypothetical protein
MKLLPSTKIDLAAALAVLPENKGYNLIATVAELEAAVASGKVMNKLVTDAKFIFNRRVEESAEAFLATGPHAQQHNQSDWWLGAYHADALVSGSHNLPAALKRVEKQGGLDAYATFLKALLPLNELLQAAKPLIVKRGEAGPTEKQIAAAKLREGKAMTCQCCGRDIFAERGKIAHHGYERPGDGFQTASCMGAQHAPFEASRTRLGQMITGLTNNRDSQIERRGKVEREEIGGDIVVTWTNYQKPLGRGHYEEERAYVGRANFAEAEGELKQALSRRGITSFDALKKNEIAQIEARIRHLNERIAYEQARYDGWKQTHRWQARQWATL